jgi:type VI protein secretion system component VasK
MVARLYQLIALLLLGLAALVAVQNGGQVVSFQLYGLVTDASMVLMVPLILLLIMGCAAGALWTQAAVSHAKKDAKQASKATQKAILNTEEAQREIANLRQKVNTLEQALDKALYSTQPGVPIPVKVSDTTSVETNSEVSTNSESNNA